MNDQIQNTLDKRPGQAVRKGIPRTPALVMLLVGGTLVVFYVVLEMLSVGRLGLPLDDSWIHLQFAKSLAEGDGLSYRPGRLVPGTTAPLWTALLALGEWLPLSPIVWAKLLGVGFTLLAASELYRLGVLYGLSSRLATLAAVTFLACDPVLFAAVSGMEISLFMAASLLGMRLHVEATEFDSREAGALSLGVLALATLARPEGALLLVLAFAERCIGPGIVGTTLRLRRRSRRGVGWGVLAAAVCVVPVASFSWWVSGSGLPSTFSVKTDEVHRYYPIARDLWRTAEVLFRPLPVALFLVGAGTVALLARLAASARTSLLPVAWLLGLPMAYSALAAPGQLMPLGNFGRYVFPLAPMIVLLGVLGLQPLVDRWGGLRLGSTRFVVWPWLFALFLLPTLNGAVAGGGRYALNVANVEDSDVAVARWIRDNLPPDAVLGTQDIGAIGYFCENPIVDLVGIVNPEVLPYIKGDLMGTHPTRLGGLMEFIRARDVDFVVVFPESYGGMTALESVVPGWQIVHEIEIERNITMAGSRLVVALTPWSSYRRQP